MKLKFSMIALLCAILSTFALNAQTTASTEDKYPDLVPMTSSTLTANKAVAVSAHCTHAAYANGEVVIHFTGDVFFWLETDTDNPDGIDFKNCVITDNETVTTATGSDFYAYVDKSTGKSMVKYKGQTYYFVPFQNYYTAPKRQ